MDVNKSILEDIRVAVGLTKDTVDFDTDLIMNINAAIGKLNQNGVGNSIVVTDSTTTWGDLQNPDQTEGNKFFHMIPLFVALSTKLIFDPPPPSSVEFHSRNVDQNLWRLKVAYESDVI